MSTPRIRPCVGARGSPCHQAHFQKRLAAHYNIGFPLSCHYQTLSLKADPKDRQSIRRQSSHLYLLNVLMSSIFRPRGFASGYWSRGGDRWCEVLDCRIRRSSQGGEGGNALALSAPRVAHTEWPQPPQGLSLRDEGGKSVVTDWQRQWRRE